MIHRKATFKYLLPACLGLALACSIVFIKGHSRSQTIDLTLISSRLNTIQTQLKSLQQDVKKPADTVDLTAIKQDFNKLASLIEQLRNNDKTTLNQLIQENRTELTQKLDALREMITALDNKQHPIKYLPVTSLPFKVISIDSIQQASVATIAYNFKTSSLEKSDKLAGWTVLSIDFGQQRMELENSNTERVVVQMQAEQGTSDA